MHHDLPTELLDTALKAFFGVLATRAISALFKKSELRILKKQFQFHFKKI